MSKATRLLNPEKMMLQVSAATKEEAIRLAGQLLVEAGHVPNDYVDRMLEREALLSTYIGNGVAIPHGTNESKQGIRSTGISLVQVPDGVDFGDGQTAYLLFGIAAAGDEHLDLLSVLAVLCSDEVKVNQLRRAQSAEEMIALLEEAM